MRHRFALATLPLLLACSGNLQDEPPTDAGTTDSHTPEVDGQAGAQCVPVPEPALKPGTLVHDPQAKGSGPCANKTVEALIQEVHAAFPALSDISQVEPESAMSDGSFVYPYLRGDGRFALVFKRGLGDCPAGCTDNYYFYFDTDASCTPTQVGTCHPVWQQDCVLYEGGQPMWGHPIPAEPTKQCALDPAPQDVSGSHRMHAKGQVALCKSGDSIEVDVVQVDECIELVVDQATPSSATGTAYIAGLGQPLLEKPIPITIRRKAGSGLRQDPGVCMEGSTAELSFDLEGWAHGSVEVFQLLEDAACKSYCKGAISLKLSAAQ